jgi:hypothetical protein
LVVIFSLQDETKKGKEVRPIPTVDLPVISKNSLRSIPLFFFDLISIVK